MPAQKWLVEITVILGLDLLVSLGLHRKSIKVFLLYPSPATRRPIWVVVCGKLLGFPINLAKGRIRGAFRVDTEMKLLKQPPPNTCQWELR